MWIRLGTGYSRESLCSSSAILRFWGDDVVRETLYVLTKQQIVINFTTPSVPQDAKLSLPILYVLPSIISIWRSYESLRWKQQLRLLLANPVVSLCTIRFDIRKKTQGTYFGILCVSQNIDTALYGINCCFLEPRRTMSNVRNERDL